ncbi:biopolymer transporter ExbD [Nitratiruptor sp. YY09-18]|uniref:ExbD/TolR family protein n=1 Tax=Nitratiruptor sp. YY09-18 TaxID=2724901 RepID=UPI001915D3ED|nr:biopolymer transporter ExbD [Nitratiruptor sp. YY09-18]BCD68519.1 biopolymer transport protein ExbD [Nitratiruptor sp. YY09-18]
MKLKKFDQINVIPFIDIMLVLLVIVLTTATFIAKGVIPLDLPQASSTKELPLKKIAISIDKNGNIYLDSKKISLEELAKRFKQINKKSNVIIRSDKNSKFLTFIQVLDLLKREGFENIAVETVK